MVATGFDILGEKGIFLQQAYIFVDVVRANTSSIVETLKGRSEDFR
jgi:hypothetical protein